VLISDPLVVLGPTDGEAKGGEDEDLLGEGDLAADEAKAEAVTALGDYDVEHPDWQVDSAPTGRAGCIALRRHWCTAFICGTKSLGVHPRRLSTVPPSPPGAARVLRLPTDHAVPYLSNLANHPN
jgi:hypothetical protein